MRLLGGPAWLWWPGGSAALVGPGGLGGLVTLWVPMMSWFPINVARNSHVNLSNVAIGSLELQRF